MKLGGKNREFKYTVNSIRHLINMTGKTPSEILNGFDPTDFDLGVKLICCGLLWENPKLTPDMVGDWLEVDDGVYSQAITDAVNALVVSFQRQFKIELEEVDEEKNSQKRTGKNT
ncbi:MAG: hypothetical protein WC115_01525 [Sphaerochaeta sp.]